MDGMRKRARLGQKVSSPRARTGCLTCRKKKVKCDEGKPDCERCLRLERECTWDEPLRAIPTSCLAAKSPAIESPHVDTASTNYGHHFTAFKPPENDLSLVNHPMQSSTQFKFELALQNGPESFQTFKPATGLAVPSVDHDDSGVQSNSQLSLVTYETPIALQSYSQGFKFHFLLECNGCRQTTLRQHPWCFAQIQDMFQSDGTLFSPIQTHICEMVQKLEQVGDGCKKTVLVPFNKVERTFASAWGEGSSTTEEATLWIRVFENDFERVADTEAIESSFNLFESHETFVKNVQEAIDNPPLLTTNITQINCRVIAELFIIEKALAELYEFWMRTTTWVGQDGNVCFDKSRTGFLWVDELAVRTRASNQSLDSC